jgi:hypothetical protein
MVLGVVYVMEGGCVGGCIVDDEEGGVPLCFSGEVLIVCGGR